MTMFEARQVLKRMLVGQTIWPDGIEVVRLTPQSWEVRGVHCCDVFSAAQALVWAVQEKSS
jgi:hypothetical protein